MTADKTLILSDGRTAVIRPALGEHLEKGAAIVGAKNASNSMALLIGVASQVTTINGQGVPYEDLRKLPIADVFALIGELMGESMGNAIVPSQLSGISS